MVSQEIRSCSIALGTLFGSVSDEQAAVIRLVRQNLAVAAEVAEEMEGLFEVPRVDVHAQARTGTDKQEPEPFGW